MARYEYKHRRPPRHRIRFSRVLMFLILMGIIIYPFYEATTLKVDYRTANVVDLPANLRNLKIAFVSDIHQGQFFSQARVNSLVAQINSLGADLVILGGDYAEDSDGAISFFETAPAIQARLGVYAVVGNHDRTEPESNFGVLVGEMKSYGCTPLTNNIAKIKVGQSYITIAGVDDYYNGYPDVAGVAAQVKKDDFVIFVGHSPDLLPAAFAAKGADGDTHWFDLALFGHTHGGQVTLLGQPLFLNLTPEVGLRYLTGWKEENRASILVSNGVGTSNFPVRLFAQPQLHVITLKSK